MIHLHWYTLAVVACLVFVAGMIAMGVLKDEHSKQLRASYVAARVEIDRLKLACQLYERRLNPLRVVRPAAGTPPGAA